MGGAASLLLSGFGLAALGTSFIGSSISLSEYLMPYVDNTLSDLQEPSDKYALGRAFYRALDEYEDEKSSTLPSAARIFTFAAMLSVPLIIADTLPDIFLPMSNFVGAYGMSVMYGILPPLMAWKMRTGRRKSQARRTPQPVNFKINTLLPGGRWSLGALGASAVGIALSQVAEDITSSGVVGSIPTVAGSSELSAPLVADIAAATQQW
jgi:tyrosine-specific transport protein